eukprot:6206698-Pleurochrysis_carterae.AAC.1
MSLFVLGLDAQLRGRTSERRKVRSTKWGDRDVTGTDVPCAQCAPFRWNSECDSGTFRMREQAGANIVHA